jgi:hypothetical protein
MDQLAEILFGTQSDSLEKGGNALLLLSQIKSWFDKYCVVVVPVDPSETPIRRWRIDVITPDIKNTVHDYHDGKSSLAKNSMERNSSSWARDAQYQDFCTFTF